MRRREFIAALGGVAAWPAAVLAQATTRRPLVASLWLASPDTEPNKTLLRHLQSGMQEFGYTEGRNFDVAKRFAEGHVERLPELAAEFVQLNPDVIVASSMPPALAVANVTSTISIVVPVLADPISL